MSIGYRGRDVPNPELPSGTHRQRTAGPRTQVEGSNDFLDPWRDALKVIGPKVQASVQEYIAAGMIFNVKDFGAKGDGATDDTAALQDCLDATQAAHGCMILPSGTYLFSSLSNLGVADDYAIFGIGEVVLEHTGTGVGMDVNGDPNGTGLTSARSWGIQISNISLQGNSNTSVGWRFKHTHHGRFKNLRVLSMSGAAGSQGFRLEWCVLNFFENIIATRNEENGAGTMPETGLSIGAGATNSQGNTFVNVMFEGLNATGAVGIHLDDASRNWFYGGTSESNYQAVSIDAGCTGNTFNGMYMEDADSEHVVDNGNWTQWINCLCDDLNGAEFIIGASAVHTVIVGGEYGTIRITAGANHSFLNGISVNTLSDGGTNTVRVGVWDMDAAAQANMQLGSGIRFQPDNTHDIGQSGAARPRDLYVSRRVNAATDYQVNGTKVVGSRVTGWTAATGTASRATFDTATVTTANLAQRVKALVDDLISHGLIGA